MKNRTIHSLLALLLIFSMLLSACGKKQEESISKDRTPEFESAEDGEEKSLLWGELTAGGTEAAGSEKDAPRYYDCLEQQMSLILNPDGTGAVIHSDGVEYPVTYTTDGTDITVVGTEDQDVEEGIVQEDGSLWFDGAETLFVPVDMPTYQPQGPSEEAQVRHFDGTKYDMSFTFYADGTGTVSDLEGSDPITYTQQGDVLTVTIPSAELTFTAELQEDGNLYIEAVDDTFVAVDEPGYLPSAPVAANWTVENTYPYHLKGIYRHWDDSDYWLDFDGEGFVTYTLEIGSGSGTYHFDGEDLQIVSGSGTVLNGDIDSEEDIWIDGEDGWFVMERDNFFKESYFKANWEADSTYSLPNSARYFNEDGSTYQTSGADWRMWELGMKDNGDGTRTAEVVVGCGFRYDERPAPGTQGSYGCTYDIFDAYTGYELVGDAFYNSATGAYELDFTQNGEQISLRYTVEPEWLDESQYDEWDVDSSLYEDYLIIRLTITLPTDYDGLRIVAMRCDATFAQYSARKNAPTLQRLADEHLYMVEEGLIYKLK